MVKVIDKDGTDRTFEKAEHFLVTNEGVLFLLEDPMDNSIANYVAAFAPGEWRSASK